MVKIQNASYANIKVQIFKRVKYLFTDVERMNSVWSWIISILKLILCPLKYCVVNYLLQIFKYHLKSEFYSPNLVLINRVLLKSSQINCFMFCFLPIEVEISKKLVPRMFIISPFLCSARNVT